MRKSLIQKTLSKKREKGDEFTNKHTGDLFEIFCYDLLHREKDIFCLEKIWFWADFPYKDDLEMGENDIGVDLVGEKKNKEYLFIQAKYRGPNGTLTWKEVSTTEAISRRKGIDFLIITNTTKISRHLQNSNIRILLGNDPLMKDFSLDNIRSNDIKGGDKKEKIELREYQSKCIETLKEYEKVLLNLSCGLGKTLIASKVLEEYDSVLIFAPTLFLIDSLARRFLKEKRYDDVLVVGSDSSLCDTEGEEEEMKVPIIFQQTTDGKLIRKVLGKESKKIVLCTYRSYPLLLKYDFTQGWGVFYDECHRFSGEEFNFGEKTLFASASPPIGEKWKDIPVEAPYSFEEGVNDGYLAQYEIFLSMVGDVKNYASNPEIKVVFDDERETEESKEDGEEDILQERLYTLAVGVSIVKAIKEINETDPKGIKKTLVYSNSNKRSKLLQRLCSPLLKFFGEENVETFYTDSNRSISSRENTINSFLESERSILFSCRIFSEGVDIPQVDSVVFAESRKSTRDVIQSVGRCLRVHKDKAREFIYKVDEDYGVLLDGMVCKSWVILPCVKDFSEFEITKSIIRSMGVMDFSLKEEIRSGRKITIGGKKEKFRDEKREVVEWGRDELKKFYESVKGEVINGYTTSERAYNEFLDILEERGWKMLGKYKKAREKIILECDKGHHIKIAPDSVKSKKTGCKICLGLDKNVAKTNFKNICGERGFKINGEYINNKIKVEIECKNGHKIKISPIGFVKAKIGCSICSGNDFSHTKERFEKFLEKLGWKLRGEYIGTNNKTLLECEKGHEIFARPDLIMNRGYGCSMCSSRNPECTKNKLELILRKRHWKMLGKYTGRREKIDMLCDKGHFIKISPDCIIDANTGCNFCPRKIRSVKELKENFLYLIKGRFELLEEYKKSAIGHLVSCKNCKHQFKIVPGRMKAYRKCPKCKN